MSNAFSGLYSSTISFLTGNGVNLPKFLMPPGLSNNYQGAFGTASIGGWTPAGMLGSLVSGTSVAPFSRYNLGNGASFGIETQTGVLNVVGSTNLTGSNVFSSVATTKFLGGSGLFSFGTTKIIGASTLSLVGGAKVVVASPSIILGGAVTVAGLGNLQSLGAIWSAKKGFDIPHPTKKDHRLRYICVEGPSAEVYLRGKLENNSVIELPEYWRNLIDAETIGVTLTPIGYYQELFVEKIEWGTKIIIKNNSGSAINCSYVVFAERKDGEKNIPEYKGLTPADYPGDNREYVINGKNFV
jgi:hypothetical protein